MAIGARPRRRPRSTRRSPASRSGRRRRAPRGRARRGSGRSAPPGSSGSGRAKALDVVGGRLERHEVGLREVPVVVGLLLRRGGRAARARRGRSAASPGARPRPPRAGRSGARSRPPSPRPRNLNEFMFLSSVFVPSSVSPRGRTETLASQRSDPFSMSQSETPIVWSVFLSSAEERQRLLGRADVGLGHDLDERRAAAVEVDDRRRRRPRCARRRRRRGRAWRRPPRGARA